MQGRLSTVRNTLDNLHRIGQADTLIQRLSEEVRGLEDALVGDDPRVLAGVDYLRRYYEDSDVVLRTERGPLMHLGGNEHWVFADVAIGDDYGSLDFWKPYAIWRNTGAVYRVERDGAVEDDPIYRPGDLGGDRVEQRPSL